MFGIGFKQKIRIIEYIFPHKIKNKQFLIYCQSRVPLKHKATSVYETVELYEKIFFGRIQKSIIKISSVRIPLGTLMNIHNEDGIKDIHQIIYLTSKIKKGENITEPSGMPNIKLARLKSKDILVFDGHHSLLAYMASGRIFLDEIPHIIVSGHKGFLKSVDISVFWGYHAPKITARNWKSYVINWQKSGNKQLDLRIQRNMGELFDALKDRIVNKNIMLNS